MVDFLLFNLTVNVFGSAIYMYMAALYCVVSEILLIQSGMIPLQIRLMIISGSRPLDMI